MPSDPESTELPETGDPIEPDEPEILEEDVESTAHDEKPGKGSPNLVYAALVAGAVVLAILLLIVWLSSRDDDSGKLPLCLDITAELATESVLAGDVRQVDVLVDQRDPLKGLTAVQMQMADGDCRRLPEGADNREGLYQLLGAVAFYNEAGEQRIDVEYLRQDVPAGLLNTSTPEPTATEEPSPTVPVTPSAEPTETVSPTETVTPLSTPTRLPASPVPSPVVESSASPAASPVASPAGSPAPAASPQPSTPPASP